MRSYQWKPDFVRYEITGAEGWVYYNWALENESSVWGSGLEKKSPGYLKQEINRLLKHG